jgi:3-oxoacyl-[acyl-carrier-protein] synthase II
MMNRIPRRVVVTGIGIVSPLGCGNISVWNNLISGVCGVGMIPARAFVEKAGVHVAATVPHGDHPSEFDEKRIFGRSVCKEQSKFIQYANYAADMALVHAGNPLEDGNYHRERVGVAIASGVGSLEEICEGAQLLEQSYRKMSPYFIPKILVNLAAGQVSVRHKLQGPCHSAVTACAAGAHSIGDAANFIRLGYADMMLAGMIT